MTMNFGEFLQHALGNWENFDNKLVVISKVDCDEFNQGIRSEKIGRFIAENFYSTLFVCDGELQ